MKNFFKSPILKALLALIFIVLVGLAIWFGGPLIAIGDLEPFASVSVRVTLIILALAALLFYLLEVKAFSLIGVVALCLLVWHALPVLRLGDATPFEPVWARSVLIGLIVFCYLLWLGFKLWQLLREDETALRKFLMRDKVKNENIARNEIRQLQSTTQRAIAQLKQMHMNMAGTTGSVVSGFKRLVEGRKYLYELPWYMIIGQPAAGKTSVLLNSGINFPSDSQLDMANTQMALASNSGTINCSWWFSNEAVLLDTAGRYTQQSEAMSEVKQPASGAQAASEASASGEGESTDAAKSSLPLESQVKQSKDAMEWLGFLGILRKARSRAPINGAVVAIDAGEIIAASPQERKLLAARLRARLAELRIELGIRFPVYVVVTKSDLLKGFGDYFGNLTQEARAQVWGFSLPWNEKDSALSQMVNKAKGKSNNTATIGKQGNAVGEQSDLYQRLNAELGLLHERIEMALSSRMQEEYDLDKRRRLFALPQEFKAFSQLLLEVLEPLFLDSRYDTTQLTNTLRGIYFTSVEQEGQAVLADQGSMLAKLLRFRGRGLKLEHQGQTGKRSFFVNDFLRKVVFAESHLVRPNLRWEARFKLLRILGHSLLIAGAFFLAGALALSYKNNSDYLHQIKEKADAIEVVKAETLNNYNPTKLPKLLDATLYLADYPGLNPSDPDLSFRYGLFSQPPVLSKAQQAYRDYLKNLALPEVRLSMEGVIKEAVAKQNSRVAYDTLRVYLMLHERERYQAQEVRAWVAKNWAGEFNNIPRGKAGSETLLKPVNEASGISGSSANVVQSNAVALGAEAKSSSIAGVPQAASTPSTSLVTKPVAKATLAAGASPAAAGSASFHLAAVFGQQASMLSHLENLFSENEEVISSVIADQELVRSARAYLSKDTSSQRLYERIRDTLSREAPPAFSLVNAVGPQAGTLFTRVSGLSIEQGVNGLFTYSGYHDLFSKELQNVITQVRKEDEWVVSGAKANGQGEKKNSGSDTNSRSDAALAEEIRRMYLTEYTRLWEEYLADIRPILGTTRGFDLALLRQLAAPNSPLIRLAKQATQQTTLTRNLGLDKDEADKSLLDKAATQLDQKAAQTQKDFGLRPQTILERQYVDDRFGALREMVTGQAASAAPAGGAAAAQGAGIGQVNGLINEFYTAMTVADTAVASGALPPPPFALKSKMQLEGGRLPHPFREVILAIANNGTRLIEEGASEVLRVQAQAKIETLMSLLESSVGTMCRSGIEGRYPFAANSPQEVSIEDFNAVFGAGGPADAFFTTQILPFVDNSGSIWRYKNPDSVLSSVATTPGAPPQADPAAMLNRELLKLLQQSGPKLASFQKIAQIRQAFFAGGEGKKLGLQVDVRVLEMDPRITELHMNFDGKISRYIHGPVSATAVTWPGERGGLVSEISVLPRIKQPAISLYGPWALFRLFERGKSINSATPGRNALEYQFDGRKLLLGLTMSRGGVNPFNGDLLKDFRCPSRF
jgi:type VI secretion system protein ImpL